MKNLPVGAYLFHTETRTDRRTVRYTDRRTVRYTDRRTVRYTDRRTVRHTDRRTVRHTDRRTVRHTDRRTVRYTDRRTVRHTDRPTDLTKPIVAFRNFANSPKMGRVSQTSFPLKALIPLSLLATSICRLLDGHF